MFRRRLYRGGSRRRQYPAQTKSTLSARGFGRRAVSTSRLLNRGARNVVVSDSTVRREAKLSIGNRGDSGRSFRETSPRELKFNLPAGKPTPRSRVVPKSVSLEGPGTDQNVVVAEALRKKLQSTERELFEARRSIDELRARLQAQNDETLQARDIAREWETKFNMLQSERKISSPREATLRARENLSSRHYLQKQIKDLEHQKFVLETQTQHQDAEINRLVVENEGLKLKIGLGLGPSQSSVPHDVKPLVVQDRAEARIHEPILQEEESPNPKFATFVHRHKNRESREEGEPPSVSQRRHTTFTDFVRPYQPQDQKMREYLLEMSTLQGQLTDLGLEKTCLEKELQLLEEKRTNRLAVYRRKQQIEKRFLEIAERRGRVRSRLRYLGGLYGF